MNRTFIEVPSFTKKWYDLGFTDDELTKLEMILLNDPEAGKMIEGTGGVRKIRVAFPNRGKSGSARVCYVDFAYYESTYFLIVFTKKEETNLSEEEKKNVRKLVKQLRSELYQLRGDSDE